MRATNLLAAIITLTLATMTHAGATFTGDAAQATAPIATMDGNARNVNVFALDGQGPRWVNTAIGLRYTGARLEYTALPGDVLKTVEIKLSGTRPFNYTAGLYATASRLDGSVTFIGQAGSELADIIDIENISSWQTKGYSKTATVTKTGLDHALSQENFDTGDVATPLQNVTPGGSDVLVSSITIRYRPQFAGNVISVYFPSSVDSSTFEVPEPAPSLLLLAGCLGRRRRRRLLRPTAIS
jgi:hypothetical protein